MDHSRTELGLLADQDQIVPSFQSHHRRLLRVSLLGRMFNQKGLAKGDDDENITFCIGILGNVNIG